LAAARATPADAHDVDDVARIGNTLTNVGVALINNSGTGLLNQTFVGANYNGSSFPDPAAKIGVRGAVAGYDPSGVPRYGVYGHQDAGIPSAGVAGIGDIGYGVYGRSGQGIGVSGESDSGYGVKGTVNSTAAYYSGVYGEATPANAAGNGVQG